MLNRFYSAYKISAGSAAQLGQFPWAIALVYRTDEDYNSCGGSIISKRHIITAAHCFLKIEYSHLPCMLVISPKSTCLVNNLL